VNNKAPAFQFYAGDFLSSPDVILMSAQEVGAYCLLLFTSWQSEKQAYLDNDEDRLRRISRLSTREWKESRQILLKKFVETEDGLYRYNPRLAVIAEKEQTYRKQMQVNGKEGGRGHKKKQLVSENNQKLVLEEADGNQNESSSSLSLSLIQKQEAVSQVFNHFLSLTGRSAVAYTLTRLRNQKGLSRLEDCMKQADGDLKEAIVLMLSAVDGLAKSDWHMGRDPKTNGRRYTQWEGHLFDTTETLQKWIEATKSRSASPSGAKASYVDPATLYDGVDYESRGAA